MHQGFSRTSPVTARCPAILIAAPASGQGKTTIAAALARRLARAGRRVRAFKCGADFIDPFWLALATGQPVHNLDLWMTGEHDVRARLHEAALASDLIIVEGVMGLFDGEPSAADLARRFGLPVLAVIDASAMAGTFGALAFGLQHYRPGLPWAGVLANKVAGEGHAQMLRQALALTDGAAPVVVEHQSGSGSCSESVWLGAVMHEPVFSLPERHLGLTIASELPDALQRLDAAADALSPTPLGSMDEAALAGWMVSFAAPTVSQVSAPLLHGKTVAVARDAAFCFVYQANLDTLQQLGATLAFFSPLANEPVPTCDAVWLPGGYPELHARTLAASSITSASLAAHAARQKPVWAECGGMMVLFDQLVTDDDTVHAMWGLLPGTVTMQKGLAGLGPQRLTLPASNSQAGQRRADEFRAGELRDDESSAATLRGHTFHYSRCESPLAPAAYTKPPGSDRSGEALWQHGSIRASYFHAWFASSSVATANLFLNQEAA